MSINRQRQPMEGVAGNWGTVWRLQRTRREVLRAARSFTAAYWVSSVGGAFARGEETERPVPASLAQLDRALRDATLARQVPGVVAMAATNDGIIYEGAFGSRHLGQGPAMNYDTVFRIASMIKVVTSVAAMQLVEQGKISLDSPAPAIDPALASPRVLTGFDAAGATTAA